MVSDSQFEAGAAANRQTLQSSSAQAQLLRAQTYVAPKLVSALILRIHALVKRLLPVEISAESLREPDGLINAKVVQSFVRSGGDLADAVPFALLETKKLFDRCVCACV